MSDARTRFHQFPLPAIGFCVPPDADHRVTIGFNDQVVGWSGRMTADGRWTCTVGELRPSIGCAVEGKLKKQLARVRAVEPDKPIGLLLDSRPMQGRKGKPEPVFDLPALALGALLNEIAQDWPGVLTKAWLLSPQGLTSVYGGVTASPGDAASTCCGPGCALTGPAGRRAVFSSVVLVTGEHVVQRQVVGGGGAADVGAHQAGARTVAGAEIVDAGYCEGFPSADWAVRHVHAVDQVVGVRGAVVGCQCDAPVGFVLTDQFQVVLSPQPLVTVLDLVFHPVGFPPFLADLAQAGVAVEFEQRCNVPLLDLAHAACVPHALCLLQRVAQSRHVHCDLRLVG
uniref:Uncharacterized protein n=1 Tax=Streptomyces ribosidificus TaxID=80859 RepID=Q2MFD9_STRRI|nr:hypothetical protein [Streptomyces ribosidificus]